MGKLFFKTIDELLHNLGLRKISLSTMLYMGTYCPHMHRNDLLEASKLTEYRNLSKATRQTLLKALKNLDRWDEEAEREWERFRKAKATSRATHGESSHDDSGHWPISREI